MRIRNCHFSRYDSGSKPGTRVVYAARAIMESLPAALPIQLVWEVGYLRSALCLRESSHCACWDIQSAEHASGGGRRLRRGRKNRDLHSHVHFRGEETTGFREPPSIPNCVGCCLLCNGGTAHYEMLSTMSRPNSCDGVPPFPVHTPLSLSFSLSTPSSIQARVQVSPLCLSKFHVIRMHESINLFLRSFLTRLDVFVLT
mmetsp:Transcript_4392/g.9764  ORF Transcript_4392/g.9764 Transcript_4392/m.9764 type:complete len:200 (-) Transcript_4392:171-770(-)